MHPDFQTRFWADVTVVTIRAIEGTPTSLPEVEKCLKGIATLAPLFIDTGAYPNLIRKDLYEKLSTKTALIPSKTRFQGEWDKLGGGAVSLGAIYLKVSMNNATNFTARFQVCAGGNHPLLLGNVTRRQLDPLFGQNFVQPLGDYLSADKVIAEFDVPHGCIPVHSEKDQTFEGREENSVEVPTPGRPS